MSGGISTSSRVALRRWAVGGALISLTAGLGSLVPATQAALAASIRPATVVAGPGLILAADHKGKCVEDANNAVANNTPVQIGTCGDPGTSWTIESDGTIQTNGKCLDIRRDGKVNKVLVELWTCTGGSNQVWMAENGTLVNPVSRKCLDDPRFSGADGTQLKIYTCSGGKNQRWVLPS